MKHYYTHTAFRTIEIRVPVQYGKLSAKPREVKWLGKVHLPDSVEVTDPETEPKCERVTCYYKVGTRFAKRETWDTLAGKRYAQTWYIDYERLPEHIKEIILTNPKVKDYTYADTVHSLVP